MIKQNRTENRKIGMNKLSKKFYRHEFNVVCRKTTDS